MIITPKGIDSHQIKRLQSAVQSKASVKGTTHNYYRYPARFSPKFVQEVIDIFSESGDVILDPFVGGGTTLVESLVSNRHSIGFDVSPIASFVSTTKTTILSEADIIEVSNWLLNTLPKKLTDHIRLKTFYDDEGYINTLPWRIKAYIEIIINDITQLKTENQQNFARCLILRTAQWATDCRKKNPTLKEFRATLKINLEIFIKGIKELIAKVLGNSSNNPSPLCVCVNCSSEYINDCEELSLLPEKPKLVITSPPYIGVNILYHQWQVNSRKRTRAPFWIINALDGHGSGHYTFGYHRTHSKKTYFEIAKKIFTSIHSAIHNECLIVQLVGFSDHRKYLSKYLEMMSESGYEEVCLMTDKLNRVKRIWRNVPNRKWYTNTKNEVASSKEVLLVHCKRR